MVPGSGCSRLPSDVEEFTLYPNILQGGLMYGMGVVLGKRYDALFVLFGTTLCLHHVQIILRWQTTCAGLADRIVTHRNPLNIRLRILHDQLDDPLTLIDGPHDEQLLH